MVVDAAHGQVPAALLFPEDPYHAPARRDARPRGPTSDRFETMSWTSDRPLSLAHLQAAIGKLAPKLARAKGLFEAVEQPGRQFVFQFAGGRATAGALAPGSPRARIVFVAEIGALSAAEVDWTMGESAYPGPD